MPGEDGGCGLGGLSDNDDDLSAEELTPAEIMALEADGVWDDSAWLEELYAQDVPPEEAGEAEDPGGEEILEAGFTHGESGFSGRGFESGGVIDRMLPGRNLAAFTATARAIGVDQLNDDALIGFVCAARRGTSWQQALELAGIAELDRRRSGPDGRPGEHVAEEVAAALRLTGRAAEGLLGLAQGISRLAQVPAALAAGVIDLARAEVFARELLVLDDELAVRAEALVMPPAADLTTGKLAAALQRAVRAVDPGAAQRRTERAEKEGRVEAWTEPGRGTAALAGRDLPAAEVIAADKRITAAARWLRGHGAGGGMDWLRSRAYLGFLNGDGLDDVLARLLPHHADGQDHGDASNGQDHEAGANGHEQAVGTSHGGATAADGACADGLSGAGSMPASGDTPADGSDTPPGGPASGSDPEASGSPGRGSDPDAGARVPPGLASPPVPPGLAALTGSVNLVMPALAWLGLTDAPGEITGTPAGGPADATTCRDLATALAARKDARWCLTLTGPDGRAVAHGCGRRGPGPPGPAGPGPPDLLGWMRSIPLIPVERGECAHRLEVPGYRPSPRLRHQVKTRSPRCSFPGCRRPAAACDDDHTLAWHDGGRTCECNLAPLCRRHHRAKQAPGWQLTQPRPGTLVWTLPSGRSYTTEPEPYLV